MPFRGGVVRVSAVPLPPAHSSAAGEDAGHSPSGLGPALLSSRDDAFAGFAMPGLDSMDLNDDDADAQGAQPLRPSYLGVRRTAAHTDWGGACAARPGKAGLPCRLCQLLAVALPTAGPAHPRRRDGAVQARFWLLGRAGKGGAGRAGRGGKADL